MPRPKVEFCNQIVTIRLDPAEVAEPDWIGAEQKIAVSRSETIGLAVREFIG